MSLKVYMNPKEVYRFFLENEQHLSDNAILIMENEETKYKIYLTEEHGYPYICVCKGDGPFEFEEYAVDEKDCVGTIKQAFETYLRPVTVITDIIPPPEKDDEDDVDMDEAALLDEMYIRDDELRTALCDFLAILTQENSSVGDGLEMLDEYGADTLDDILAAICVLLADDFGLPVYRPMFIEDPDGGGEYYVEYPYNEYDFTEVEE